MGIKLKNITAENNGKGGVLIEGDQDIEIDRLDSRGNKLEGLKITKHSQADIPLEQILEQIGLPPGTDSEIIREAIRAISSNGASNPTEVSEVLSRTRLGKWIKQEGLNMMAISANIITILRAFSS